MISQKSLENETALLPLPRNHVGLKPMGRSDPSNPTHFVEKMEKDGKGDPFTIFTLSRSSNVNHIHFPLRPLVQMTLEKNPEGLARR